MKKTKKLFGKKAGGTSDGQMVENPMSKKSDKKPKSKGKGYKKSY